MKDNLVFIRGEPRGFDKVKEEAIDLEVDGQGCLVAHWTIPLGLLLIHHEVQLSIETLQMITG